MPARGPRTKVPSLLQVVVFLCAFLPWLTPRFAAAQIGILGLLVLLQLLRRGAPVLNAFRGDPIFWTMMGFLAYLAANATWALDPTKAITKTVTLLAIFVSVLVCRGALLGRSSTDIRQTVRAIYVGAAAGCAVLLFDLATDQFVSIAFFNLLPFARPEGLKQLMMEGDTVVVVMANALNRNVALGVLLLWPALLAARLLWPGRAGHYASVPLLCAAFGVVFFSVNETSQLALIAGALVFAAAWFWPKVVHWAMAIGWVAAFAFAIPFGLALYKAEIYKSEWLPDSGQARIIIWGYTAEQALKRPITGIGVRSTRSFDAKHRPGATSPEGHSFPRRVVAHAHNMYVQTWFEIGAIGAAFLAFLGVMILRRIGAAARDLQPYMLAGFASVATIAAFGWGMWQTWLMAGYALLAALFLITVLASTSLQDSARAQRSGAG